MAITQAELDRARLELETRITTVTVEHVSMAQAIGFNVQTVLMTVLGILVLFGDPIRGAVGL